MPYFIMLRSGVSYEVLLKKKKKKTSDKTYRNQNIPALPLFRWSVELMDIQSFSNCSVQRTRVFLSANQPILLRLES